MPNFVSLLKEEIARLARKEVRAETEQLKKTVSTLRADAAALKRRVHNLEAELRKARKAQSNAAPAPTAETEASTQRFSAKGLAANRRRLGLSADDFALLVGTTGQSIYAWEQGKTQPRGASVAAIAALRGVGKRETQQRLAELKAQA